MLPIQKMFISYNRTKRTQEPKYLVIHDVGAVSSAINNAKYFAAGDRQSSADFFIDSNNIVQIVDYKNYYSWAVGDGSGKYGITNGNSLSIEMCLESNLQPSDKTLQNTLDLTRYLMKELNISIENVVRHYDASRKICPRSMSANNWEKWNDFKKRLVENNQSQGDGYKVKNIVLCSNGVDKRAAGYLADHLKCSIAFKGMISDADLDQFKNVYEIGGTQVYKRSIFISGSDRYDTCQKVLDFIAGK